MENKWQIWDKRVRDVGLYIVGMLGVINELFIQPEPRPTSLVFLATVLGIPFVLRADEKRRDQ